MTESHWTHAQRWLQEHDIRQLTWGHVDNFIRENGFDDDEYFELHTIFRHRHSEWHSSPVYDHQIRWVAVYWVVGGSEGFYVHVETRERETGNTELVFLGKFWDVARAEQAANAIQALVNAVSR